MNKESIEDKNIKEFKEVLTEMVNLYERKNKDYGNSFDKTLNEDGLLVLKIRLSDKLNRFSKLIKISDEERQVKNESIRDTLIDLANYAVMGIKWMDTTE